MSLVKADSSAGVSADVLPPAAMMLGHRQLLSSRPVPEIKPFPGVFYRVPEADLPNVLAPPYDVIPPAYQDELYARDARNVVRLVLNRTAGDAGYAEVEATYRQWRETGLLTPDEVPALYVLEQSFATAGRTLRRFGVLARFRAVDPQDRVVLPHEHTRALAKEDRWRVLQATHANFSPIFLMFPDPERRFTQAMAEAMTTPAGLHYADDGHTQHRLWRVTDEARIATFTHLLAPVKAYIADGHHRYATALRHRDAHGPDGAWTFGYFTPMEAPGLVIEPYHRILSAGPSREAAETSLAARFHLREADSVGEAATRVARSTRPWWRRRRTTRRTCSPPAHPPACACSTPTSSIAPSSARSCPCRTRR
jgi:uncharacterized protein (DUF1015 family)